MRDVVRYAAGVRLRDRLEVANLELAVGEGAGDRQVGSRRARELLLGP